MSKLSIKEKFLLKDQIERVNRSFVDEGWITVYESSSELAGNTLLLYCGLVKPPELESYLQSNEWRITPGGEGKPSIIQPWGTEQAANEYHTYDEEQLEPFIFSKYFSFDAGYESYVDIGEEFVLYFKLLERVNTKQDRTFYFIDEAGDLEEVILIAPKRVKVKLKFLKEYLAVRKLYMSICFDIMRFEEVSALKNDWEPMDDNFVTKRQNYNHLIRVSPSDASKLQSWIHGKTVVDYDPAKTILPYFDREFKYERFIVGFSENGDELMIPCNDKQDYQYAMIFFRKEVLSKYYNDPGKYEVDGFSVKSNIFNLRIDNNMDQFVAVFLKDLSSLPHKEQLHWKGFNVAPKQQISSTFFKTMIEGNWGTSSESVDLYFKELYESFNEKWQKKFGWPFYKPLPKENKRHFSSLHVPTTNNEKTFYEQILSLVIVTIDSLNEKELSRGIVASGVKGSISKLELFLEKRKVKIPEMIEFLRHLQKLRSGGAAHRFSTSDKDIKETIAYFKIREDNFAAIARDIFEKSIFTMNTLDKIFLKM